MTQSRTINMYTVEHTPSRKASALADSLKKIIKTYGRGGFMVNLILMDQEFDKTVDRMDTALYGNRKYHCCKGACDRRRTGDTDN